MVHQAVPSVQKNRTYSLSNKNKPLKCNAKRNGKGGQAKTLSAAATTLPSSRRDRGVSPAGRRRCPAPHRAAGALSLRRRRGLHIGSKGSGDGSETPRQPGQVGYADPARGNTFRGGVEIMSVKKTGVSPRLALAYPFALSRRGDGIVVTPLTIWFIRGFSGHPCGIRIYLHS